MTDNPRIEAIAFSLEWLTPTWLPAYDLKAYAAKVDTESGYSAEMSVAMEIGASMFEEATAFVQVCGAFATIHRSPAHQYMSVRDDIDEINEALAHNAAAGCPTYAGLLAVLVERGIVRKMTDEPRFS
jgi:hypothetical protein